MAARITVTTLAAQVAEIAATQAQQTEALTALTGVLARLVEGQHATPAPVADLAVERKARKGTKAVTGKRPLAGAAKAKHEARQALTPAQQAAKDQAAAEAREAYKARKAALSPLNKALFAQGLTGDAWAGRFSNEAALKAALATLTKAQRTAALEALAAK
jgi:hypothetical protein